MSIDGVEPDDPSDPCPPAVRGDVPWLAVISNLGPVDGEDQGVSGRDPDDDWGDEADGGQMLGWIPPDDRLWRHPSEHPTPQSGSGGTPPGGALTIPPRARPGPWILGGATACIAVALAATGLVIADTAQGGSSTTATNATSLTGAPTTDPGLGRWSSTPQIADLVSLIRPSTVALAVEGAHGTTFSTGLVVESGGIIVTASRVLSGARVITVIEPNGSRQLASVIGIDQASGIAVVRIGDDLPVATFADDDLASGTVAMAVAMEPARQADRPPAPLVFAGTVVSSGQALGADAVTTSFSSTAVNAPLTNGDLGCPLLDNSGRVAGMLEMTTSPGGSTLSVFLPAVLVAGVARQLVSSGAVNHGWLGAGPVSPTPATLRPTTTMRPSVTGTTTPVTTVDGAVIGSVPVGSPAALGGLASGDVIVALDGHQVHTTAELQTRLYPDPPGTTVAVTFEREGRTMTALAVLADAGAAAPDGVTAP
jgi:putative serine protease PepD